MVLKLLIIFLRLGELCLTALSTAIVGYNFEYNRNPDVNDLYVICLSVPAGIYLTILFVIFITGFLVNSNYVMEALFILAGAFSNLMMGIWQFFRAPLTSGFVMLFISLTMFVHVYCLMNEMKEFMVFSGSFAQCIRLYLRLLRRRQRQNL